MKKTLLIALCIFCTLPAVAYFEPQWSDFCPPNMVNIDTSKHYVISSKSYWAKRKAEFEQNKNACRCVNDATQKMACFEELRNLENSKSQNYYGMMQQRANNATMLNLIRGY